MSRSVDVELGFFGGLRKVTRIASNKLIGSPTWFKTDKRFNENLIPAMRPSWKIISDKGTCFHGWSKCSITRPNLLAICVTLCLVKYQRCWGGVIRRQLFPDIRANTDPKSPVVTRRTPP